ncbi:hypothetical protein MTP99_008794 [Tenebrio molitor]|nr:hypothetical protein MTP99_008794 [Tenebrio molitor]
MMRNYLSIRRSGQRFRSRWSNGSSVCEYAGNMNEYYAVFVAVSVWTGAATPGASSLSGFAYGDENNLYHDKATCSST